MKKIVKNEIIPLSAITDNNTSSRSALYVSGSGEVDLLFIDPEGVENIIHSYIPGDSDVVNHGIASFLAFRVTGASVDAPLYLAVKGIE